MLISDFSRRLAVQGAWLSVRRDMQRGPSGGAQSLAANCLAQPALPFPGNHENIKITLHTPNTAFSNIDNGLLPAKLVLA